MRNYLITGIISTLLILLSFDTSAQLIPKKFGSGFRYLGVDSTFYLKAGFRFQNLYVGEWDVNEGEFENFNSSFLVRRSRLKFDGWAFSPKVKYKLELSLSNRDLSGGNTDLYRNAPNLVLDAKIDWNFWKTVWIRFGQGKLPGNRERLVSSGNLQFVDRSRLNSRFTTDRDVGVMLINKGNLGNSKAYAVQTISLHSGEGRNITEGNQGGIATAYKFEIFPFGKFQSKGSYIGSAIKYEKSPKLAVALAYENNANSVRERGEKGSFILNEDGSLYEGQNLNTMFVDAMFKYQSFSAMFEFADRRTESENPIVKDIDGNEIGTYYTGNAFNFAVGYMLKDNWEIALRVTDVNPDAGVGSDENQYTLGINKFVVGHKLKVQTDFTIIDKFNDALSKFAGTSFLWRTQVDIHF